MHPNSWKEFVDSKLDYYKQKYELALTEKQAGEAKKENKPVKSRFCRQGFKYQRQSPYTYWRVAPRSEF